MSSESANDQSRGDGHPGHRSRDAREWPNDSAWRARDSGQLQGTSEKGRAEAHREKAHRKWGPDPAPTAGNL